jgi:transposase-like protein
MNDPMSELVPETEPVKPDEPQAGDVDASGACAAFSPKQQMLLAALVSDASVQVAAQAAGVCRSTAHVWLQQPAFQKELAQRRNAALSEALAGVQSQAGRAAAKLATLLEAEDGRLCRMVCNDILNHAIKMRDTEEFARRLHSLEEKIEQLQKEKTA